MPKSKVAIISIGVLVVICLVSLAFPTINMIKSITSKIESSNEKAAESTAEEKKVEDQALDSIEKTSEILGQKITAITQDEASKNTIYTFANNQKFEIPLNTSNNCQVGDKIISFEESKNLFVCGNSTDSNPNNTNNRGFYVPNSWLSGIVGGTAGNIASSLIFGRFFSGNTYLRNNGFTPNYANGQNSFTNIRGDNYNFGENSSSSSSSSSSNRGSVVRTSGRGSISKNPGKTTASSGKASGGKATGSGTTGGFGSGGKSGTS